MWYLVTCGLRGERKPNPIISNMAIRIGTLVGHNIQI